MNARMIVDIFPIQAAAIRSLLSEQQNNLTTKTLHSELVYNVSGSRNVTEAYRRFGIADESDKILIAVFDDDSSGTKMDSICRRIDGEHQQLVGLPQKEAGDLQRIRKYFKIQPSEEKNTSLVEAVVTRIAIKACSK